MNRKAWSPYSARFVALGLGVAAIMIGAALAARGFPRGSAARVGLALVQGAASATLIIAMVRSIRQLDEFQQRVQLEALAFSFEGTGVFATAYGFLVNAGLPEIEWGAVIWPLMVGLWAIGLTIANRRYR